MSKRLVTADNVTDFINPGATEIQVDNSMIVTSGAKDYLRDKGVKIVYTKKAAAPVGSSGNGAACQQSDLETVVTRIVSILRNDFRVSDAGIVERVTQRVLLGLKR